jgi:hypothetical protein
MKDETREKMSKASTGKKHTQESKDKISRTRIKYLKENPDKVPYLFNHCSKERSYPGIYFKGIFDSHGVDYTEQYRISTYQLDFAILDKKIDIEIDGDQYHLDKRIVKCDIRRNKFLIDEG